MGHSMGAGAVLDFATRDLRPAVVVALSGGYVVDGPRRPPNVLFVWADGDPSFIRDESRHLASRLAGQPVTLDRTYGDFATSTAVRATVLPGLNHGTELWSGKTVAQTVGWLDQAFGTSRPRPARRVDPRLGTAGLYQLCMLVLIVGLGLLAARLSPRPAAISAAGGWAGLGVVTACLVGALPFAGLVSTAGFLSLEAGDVVVAYLAVAGAALVVLVTLARRSQPAGARPTWLSSWPGPGDLPTLALPAAVSVGGIYVLLAPMGVVGHRLVPTPARLIAGIVASLLMAPFFIAFQALVRRGRPALAALRSILGHAVLVATLLVGVWLGLLPAVVGLLLAIYVIVFVLVEFFAAGFYPSGRSGLLIGIV
jgi:hypothetical protein